ncbi:MAG: glycoside hydrolase family 16 protein [Hyphomonas sp.]|nr:glycoside hydrolase family 16 protein [Hyphomonas sp.]MCB9970775.1 glycoside hydrolase family 16 protein [Hyphomonas sp.]
MRAYSLVALISLLLVSACETPTFSALDEKDPHWKLVFSDEFSGEGRPDPDKWISKEYNRRPNANGPDGWWDPKNAFLNGHGQLVLRTSQIPNRNPDQDNDPYDYATAMVSTEGKFEQAYGRFEARAKLPHAPGWWAAFWLFSNKVNHVDGSGRDGTEVDIVETFGWTDKVNQALHWDGYGKEHQWVGSMSLQPGIRKGWHTFTLEWSPDEYVFYIDGRETWRSRAGGVSQVPLWVKLSGELSTQGWAMGDGWANKPVPRLFPDDFLVDWVRVYQRVPDTDK